MKSILTRSDLEEARTLPRAFIFIWVEWAVQALVSDAAFRAFIDAWNSDQPGCPVPMCCVDLSEQNGEVWVAMRDWLSEERQPVDLLTYGGNGALLWVRFGAVVASVPYVAGLKRPELVALTRKAFDCGNVSAD